MSDHVDRCHSCLLAAVPLSSCSRARSLSLSLSLALSLSISFWIFCSLSASLCGSSTQLQLLTSSLSHFHFVASVALRCLAVHAINCEQHIASSSGFIDGASVFHLSVLPCCRLSLLCCALPLPLRVLQELPGITALSDA